MICSQKEECRSPELPAVMESRKRHFAIAAFTVAGVCVCVEANVSDVEEDGGKQRRIEDRRGGANW